MKKLFILLSAILLATTQLSAQRTYLVNNCAITDSDQRYKVYKYSGTSSPKIEMAGGEAGYGGFAFWGEGAHVTFDLNGQYETLSFVMGHYKKCYDGVGVVTIKADGKKLMDEKVKGYDIPHLYSINVRGVSKLTFSIVAGAIDVAVADAMLWKSGETPADAGKKSRSADSEKELVKDLKPYFTSNFMEAVTPHSQLPIKLNGKEYAYGLRGKMDMAILGTNQGYAYFNLGGQYATVSFIAGCRDDVTGAAGSGWITVKADDKIIEEIEVKEGQIARQVTLDIKGCRVLSFHSEQISGNSTAEIAEIVAYPEGLEVAAGQNGNGMAAPDPRLKTLPDVCRLISNIPPYQVVGKVEKQIYDGSSDYLTFSMGGTKYSEGIILYQTSSLLDDNLSACAAFDLGNEFDYISFTAGYVGKSWNMNNDELRVYADDELVFSAPLVPTCPNSSYVVPVKKCRVLKFANKGSGKLDVAAFGVADIVAYRGEPVENDLFVHPRPDCPQEIDLIDLGHPYIHYVSVMADKRDQIMYDGSTKKNYFEVNGERVYKGFILQTSKHFSLDYGVFGDNGRDAAASAAVGATAVGASFVATGVAVGGLTVGVTMAPLAAFLLLAAGGEAVENSCAAFNTYGEYNSVTFKVACLPGTDVLNPSHELLTIGADQEVVATIGIYEGMEPQEITVPIDGCGQLMFWLSHTNGVASEKYLIYDIVVSKDRQPLSIPVPVRMSLPQITDFATPEVTLKRDFKQVSSSNKSKEVDQYLVNARIYYDKLLTYLNRYTSEYKVYTYYFDSSAGVCRAVQMRDHRTPKNQLNMRMHYEALAKTHLKILEELRKEQASLTIANVSANAGLIDLGFDAVKYRKAIKETAALLKQCFAAVDKLYESKKQEYAFWKQVVPKAMNVDGVSSTDKCIICPLASGEEAPTGELQHLKYFDLVER